ncbi:hypothetical protein WJX72_004575 [[Myrmecia] bisecta]|uniref:PITH domain-containing protein n=1 Tax=[Myrmecia] bisecta TaxID=41462 RepID=A0AAW1Q302_9CHLO
MIAVSAKCQQWHLHLPATRMPGPPTQGCCAHDHDCSEADCGPAWSLHRHIDLPNVRCLNEAESGSVRNVFRAWEQRLDTSLPPLVSNEDDGELLIHIPFDGSIRVKAICIIGGTDGTAPAELKAYVNRDDLDFGLVADMPPVQKWDLQEDGHGQIEYPTQIPKFSGIHSLDLHIPRNFGADVTKIHFIGLKGDYTPAKREAVIAVYESRPMPQDHTVPDSHPMAHQPTAREGGAHH